MKSDDYLQPKKTKAKPKEERRLSGTFKPDASGVMDGWVEIDKEGYHVLQYSPPAGTKVFFNDSLLLDADEKGRTLARLLSCHYVRQSMRCASGEDEWWNKPVVRW